MHARTQRFSNKAPLHHLATGHPCVPKNILTHTMHPWCYLNQNFREPHFTSCIPYTLNQFRQVDGAVLEKHGHQRDHRQSSVREPLLFSEPLSRIRVKPVVERCPNSIPVRTSPSLLVRPLLQPILHELEYGAESEDLDAFTVAATNSRGHHYESLSCQRLGAYFLPAQARA